MSKHQILVIFSIIALLAASVTASLWVDRAHKIQTLDNLVANNTKQFSEQVQSLNQQLYTALSDLPMPAHCDADLFEDMVYRFKFIKNIGLMRDDKIQCDVYQGNLFKKDIKNYSTFKNDNNKTYKYWLKQDYITLVNENGYFIQYDINYYLDFFQDDEISGFMILGRHSNDLWFDRFQHALTESDHAFAQKAVKDAFEKLKASGNTQSPVEQSGSMIFQLIAADDNSVVAVYSMTDYVEPFNAINYFYLISGILLGVGVSILLAYWYLRQQTLKSMLFKAIKQNDLHMVYQPLVDLQSREQKVVGFEALVRWTLKNGDSVRPDVFIPLAEQWGFTHRLTQCIIEKIFADLHTTLLANPHLYVSINITPSDLYDASLNQALKAQIAKYGVKATQVIVELTERVIADEKTRQGIEALRQSGFAISIDDFGTGSSNIKYLAELSPDIIKVDRAFVVWSETEGPTSNLLQRLIQLGKEFGIKVVVEGIETLHQARRCADLGADVGQGYYWYKPMTKELLLNEPLPI